MAQTLWCPNVCVNVCFPHIPKILKTYQKTKQHKGLYCYLSFIISELVIPLWPIRTHWDLYLHSFNKFCPLLPTHFAHYLKFFDQIGPTIFVISKYWPNLTLMKLLSPAFTNFDTFPHNHNWHTLIIYNNIN